MSVYWAALLWILPALTTKEDVTGSPQMSGTNTGLGMSRRAPGIQASSIHRGVQGTGTCSWGKWWLYLFLSSAQVFVPYMSTFQRRKIENRWTSVRSQPSPWEEKNINLCCSWRMGGQRRIICTLKAAWFAVILGSVPHFLGYRGE